jgi:16S rRNA (uracil1498-N3)-methyltransferase
MVNQTSRVFRLKTGDGVILFDGSGNDYECAISDLHKGQPCSITFKVEKHGPSRYMPDREIALCVAVVKKDTFEWIVEKATELGVTKIIPIVAERSEKKNLNKERLNKIAVEASEQSGRGNVPIIHPIISLQESIKWVVEKKIPAAAFHLDGEIYTQDRSAPARSRPAQNTELFIGPEGGWSPTEIEMFHTNKIPLVSLGKQVLRTETAVVAALSLTLLNK